MTILEIFALSEEQKRVGLNQNYTDNPLYSQYKPYTDEREKFKRLDNTLYPIAPPIDIVGLAKERLRDIKDLNLFQPQGEYELTNIEQLATGLPDPGNIEQFASVKYAEDVLVNAYQNDEREIVDIPIGTSAPIRYGNYQERANIFKALDNRNIVDVFLGVNGQDDSELGVSSADALRKSLQLNFEENLERLTFGRLNTSLYSLYRDQTLIKKDFEITVNPNPLGRTVEILQKLQGITLPFSYCPPNIQGLYGDNGYSAQEMAAILFEYTGRATKGIIGAAMRKNEYRPFIEDRNDSFTVLPNYYIFQPKLGEDLDAYEFNSVFDSFGDSSAFGETGGDGTPDPYYGVSYVEKDGGQMNPDLISSSSRHLKLSDENTNGRDALDWSKNTRNKFSPKSLLHRTKELALSNGKNIVIDSFQREYIIKKNGEEHRISKGNSITSKGAFTYDDDVSTQIGANEFFRAFHKGFKYNQLARALRHRTLDNGEKRTVLGKNGMPYYMSTVIDGGDDYIKRTFFSIENLAWKNNIGDLPECERGTPDINGNVGRWMSFPPYDLKFSENVAVNWNQVDFMARGEKIYTYNNTSRTGTLSFTMVVDHPDVVNKARGQVSHIWERYFQGDKSVESEVSNLLANRLSPSEREELKALRQPIVPTVKAVTDEIVPDSKKKELEDENNENLRDAVTAKGKNLISIYFPNESTKIPAQPNGNISENAGYEQASVIGDAPYSLSPDSPLYYTYNDKGIRKDTVNSPNDPYTNELNYSLNIGFYDANRIITDFFQDLANRGIKNVTIYPFGFASKATTTRISNITLADRRAASASAWIKAKLNELGLLSLGIEIKYEEPFGYSDNLDNLSSTSSEEDEYGAKLARRADIWITEDNEPIADVNDANDIKGAGDIGGDPQYAADADENGGIVPQLSPELYEKLFYSECDWFEEVKITDPFLYETISEKIKFFHPAYHSLTPTTFHKRLTFMHQCTRQGGSDVISANRPNLAFGTQPLLKLMIGDFFHTYFIIEGMDINYEASESIMWDTNPEGNGVQPMLCKISLNIVILGSQSLSAPINRLNNALSFNFYANTSSYDARANDVVFRTKDAGEDGRLFESEIIEGLRLSEVYNNDRNDQNITALQDIRRFRNITDDLIQNSADTLESQDDVNLNESDIRETLGLRPREVFV